MSVGDTLLACVRLALCAHAPCLPFVISIEKEKKPKLLRMEVAFELSSQPKR